MSSLLTGGLLRRSIKGGLRGKKVGFVGLGNMGLPMLQNLIKKQPDYEFQAFDLSQERVQMAVDFSKDAGKSGHGNGNCTAVGSVWELAKDKDVVFTMLFNTDTSEQVYRGAGGVFEHGKEGALLIDSTTIAPAAARAIGEDANSRGFRMADAPVSGGVTGAANGTLAFMAGCPSEQIFNDEFKPFLENMSVAGGEKIFYCGANGTGGIAKVCNNMALAIQMVSVAEAISMGQKMGMDEKLLSNVMGKSSSSCWSVSAYNPCPGVMEGVPAANYYNGGFKVSLMLKDLRLAIENAKAAKAEVAFGEHALKLYEELASEKVGLSEKDFGIVYDWVHKNGKM